MSRRSGAKVGPRLSYARSLHMVPCSLAVLDGGLKKGSFTLLLVQHVMADVVEKGR